MHSEWTLPLCKFSHALNSKHDRSHQLCQTHEKTRCVLTLTMFFFGQWRRCCAIVKVPIDNKGQINSTCRPSFLIFPAVYPTVSAGKSNGGKRGNGDENIGNRKQKRNAAMSNAGHGVPGGGGVRRILKSEMCEEREVWECVRGVSVRASMMEWFQVCPRAKLGKIPKFHNRDGKHLARGDRNYESTRSRGWWFQMYANRSS